MLHWFRLGATAALDGTADERDAFLKGVESAEALDGAWCAGRVTDEYPTHGILRRAAVIRALRGEPAEAVAALRRLGEILAGDRGERLVLQAIRLAAHAETAALLAERHPKPARRLLDGKDAAQPGLLQQLQALEAQARPEFPGVWRLFADWPDAVRRGGWRTGHGRRWRGWGGASGIDVGFAFRTLPAERRRLTDAISASARPGRNDRNDSAIVDKQATGAPRESQGPQPPSTLDLPGAAVVPSEGRPCLLTPNAACVPSHA